MLFANIDDGYLEGLLRGFRGGVLTSADYANLCQCESIDDMKVRAAANHQGTPPLCLCLRLARARPDPCAA